MFNRNVIYTNQYIMLLLVLSTHALRYREEVQQNGGNRIVGGSQAVPGQFPYQLSFRDAISNFHFCGASLYNETTAITAAHCVAGENHHTPQYLKVVAGEHSQKFDDKTEQERKVIKIISHENYGHSSYENDIALLIFDFPLFLNKYVQPITLPEVHQQFTGDCRVSGWGTLTYGGSTPDILQFVDVPLVTDSVCKSKYSFHNIKESMICAGQKGKDSCQGDSGGPMACDGLLAGIVSWGQACAEEKYPGVYTEVSYFIDWIEKNTK